MRISTSVALVAAGLFPSASLAVPVDLDVFFTATKTVHQCLAASTTIEPEPGDGNCGPYKNTPFGEAQSGHLSFSGEGYQRENGDIVVTRDLTISESGEFDAFYYLGNFSYVEYELTITDAGATFRNYSDSYWAGYEWSADGSGSFLFEDDDDPYFSRVEFVFTDVSMDGGPTPAPVPLPAALPALVAGLGALGGLRLSRRRR